MSEVLGTAPNDQQPLGREVRDLNPHAIALFGVVLAAVIAVVLAANYGLLKIADSLQTARQSAPSPFEHTRATAPGPRLQVGGAKELRELRAAEAALLTSYGWVDKEAGVVRIPVRRAMELLAQKGLPARRAAERKNDHGVDK